MSHLLSVSVGWCGAGPLQCRCITLFLHSHWLPDVKRRAVIWGCVWPGEACEALSPPQPWLLPAATALQTLKLHYLILLSISNQKTTIGADLTLMMNLLVNSFPTTEGNIWNFICPKLNCAQWVYSSICFFYWEQLLLLELMSMRFIRVNQNKLGAVKLK